MKAVIIYISVIVAATFWLSLYIAGFRISAVFLAGGLGSLLLLRPIGKTKDETLRSLKTVLYAAAVTLGCFLVSESLLHRLPAPTAGAPAETAAQVYLRSVGPVQRRTELNAVHFSSRLPNTT